MSDEKVIATETEEDQMAEVEDVVIPAELPVLPLRGAILYPYMVLPIHASSERSRLLLDEVAVGPRLLAVVAQRDEKMEDPETGDVYDWGTACRILRLMKLPDGSLRVLVQGLRRVRFDEFTDTEPYFKARVTTFDDSGADALRVSAVRQAATDMFRRLVHSAPSLSDELIVAMEAIDDSGRIADFIGANMLTGTEEKQRILESIDVALRLEACTEMLTRELKVAEIQTEIQGKVKEEMGKKSREAFLREQMRAIQSELGEDDSRQQEIDELREKILASGMHEEAEEHSLKELDRLAAMHPSAAEYSVVRTYLDWMVSVPWSKETDDRLDVPEAKRILDEDHFDLELVKDRILEYLSVLKLKKDMKGPILCLAGPPGVGKTSLGRSVARAIGREFVRMSLGGVRDEAEIRGHRRTYVGALPGRVIQALKKAGTRNPVFMLDEVDKLGSDFRGDPSSALLEVLDPAQNDTFQDHYLEVSYDLSRVLFIATANVLETIPPPLRDRMEIIQLPGYTEDQKLGIAEHHLVPRQIEGHGLETDDLSFDEGALRKIIESHTREAGVRELERTIGTVCRKIARKVAEGEHGPFAVTDDALEEHLGKPKFYSEIAEEKPVPGVVTGLVWTPVGGGIVFLEATKMKGKGRLRLTGSLGDVMKESAQAALSWVRANAEDLGIDPEEFERTEIHLHVPAGATPKDGPSAGVAMATTLASLMTGRPVRTDLAMTGEITLRGRVLPVGGIKEKVLGAVRAGIRTVVLPKRNEIDLDDIPESAREALEFTFAADVRDVIQRALQTDGDDERKAERK
jgi:ATP-dependent Lon protease